MSISQVQKAAATLGEPAKPIPAPTSIPDPEKLASLLSTTKFQPQSQALTQHTAPQAKKTNTSPSRAQKATSPSPPLPKWASQPARPVAARLVALTKLAGFCSDPNFVGTFEKPKSAPTNFEPPSTTLPSPHLHFGSLGVREF